VTAAPDDYNPGLWHDNLVYGLRFDLGDPARGDWRADLALDIDHIVEWLCAPDKSVRFRVAPATLTFHHVGDFALTVDCGDSGGQAALHVLSIDRIERQRLPPKAQKVCLDRPYYHWRVVLNWPQGGDIRFYASGFTLRLRAEPVLSDQPSLSPLERV